MSEIQWKATADKFVITLDKSAIGQADFLELLQWLRVRFLLRKANIGEDIETEGEKILSDWWEKNKQRFIQLAVS